MHKNEIRKLEQKIKEKGYTIVPVEVYFKGSLVKSRLRLQKVRSFMISGMILQRKICAVKQSGISK